MYKYKNMKLRKALKEGKEGRKEWVREQRTKTGEGKRKLFTNHLNVLF
jgi:hypothetical protein